MNIANEPNSDIYENNIYDDPRLYEPEPSLAIDLSECPNCAECVLVCKSTRVCINQPFGPALPVNERIYQWNHTSACHVIKALKVKHVSD